MSGTAQMHEVRERELSASIDALQSAVRSLRDQTGRVTAALDGVERALDWERRMEEKPAGAEEARPAGPAPSPRPLANMTSPSRPQEPSDEPTGQAELLVPGLLCALALIASVALLKIELALAVPVVLVAAVLLQMKWWMPGLAAIALGLALAISAPGGPMTDKVAAMCIVFVLTAGALLLYEIWQRLHVRLQA
jgi:hypothetical protein